MLNNKSLIGVLAALLIILSANPAISQGKDLVKKTFYKAMESDDLALVNEQLEQMDQLGKKAEIAYTGALLMKKAALLDQPGEKLQKFKAGREMLEQAIAAAPTRAEFRFLRIMIQEKAPKILGYDNNLTEDAEIVRNSFKDFSPELKDAVISYSKKSNILNIEG